MPVETPDPERHSICCRCGKWFEPWEGEVVAPPRPGPLARIGMGVAGVSGFSAAPRFMCASCVEQARLSRRLTLIVASFTLLLIVYLLSLGVFDWFAYLRANSWDGPARIGSDK